MPPASTPTAAPLPPIAPQIPSALFRSAPSSNVVVMIESAAGEMIAAPKPLHGARGDQHALEPASPQTRRRDREDRDADHEDPPAAEQVGGAAAEQQEAAERDRVGGHHPLEARVREVERRADRRQRDVDDRDVEHRHEERGADERERLPAAWVAVSGQRRGIQRDATRDLASPRNLGHGPRTYARRVNATTRSLSAGSGGGR